MAVTVSSFKDRYPEFTEASDPHVQACLDDATAELGDSGSEDWGTVYDRAISLRTAHFLALSPFGIGLQLGVRRDPDRNDTTDSGSTVYEQQFLTLRRAHFLGAMVI